MTPTSAGSPSDQQLQDHLTRFVDTVPPQAKEEVPKKKKGKQNKNNPHFHIADELDRITGVDLTRIDGVDVMVAQTLVSEVGLDMSRWKTEAHFAYQVDLLFPDAFLSQTMQYGHEVHDRRTPTHRMFRISEKEYLNEPIFPGDTKRVFSLPYFVNQTNFDSKALEQTGKATLRCGKEKPIVEERSIRDFQIF